MLSVKDNELLCKVEAGAPMGAMMRQYWLPALKSTELPGPDCPPVRLRLLGENLIGFRVTSGKVGIIQNACPHRGASLFFGRNEEEGLRCVYHGWKFDCTGQCVDMPSEPAESNFKNKIKAAAYPCIERNGVIWTYMGARETAPPLSHIESNMVPDADKGTISKILRDCNYMQALEGDIDTSHLAFLHNGAMRPGDQPVGSQNYYVVKDKSPRYLVRETEFGTAYGAYRPTDDPDKLYWRMAYFLFPFYTMIPTDVLGEAVRIRAWVPIDSSHTMVWSINAPRVPSATQGGFYGKAFGEGNRGQNFARQGRGNGGAGGNDYLPETSDWLGKFRLVANRENDYLIDREAQKNLVSYTGINGGINGVFLEDQAVTESMGQIYERDHEHLGTSDSMVIRTRRRLINAARAFQEGVIPPGVDNPEVFAVRSGGVLLPKTVDWWEGTAELRRAFVEHKSEGPVPLEGIGMAASTAP